MILVDSNIPMYLVGAPHSNKMAAQRLLERRVAEGERLVTDVEVLQEILHRYVAIGCRDAIEAAFAVLLGIVDEVFPIDTSDLERAKVIVLGTADISARDALHLAVMQRRGIVRIMTLDRGFDGLPGVIRITD